MKNGFIFYSSFRETANKLQKEDRADFYEAIIEYSFTGVVPELTGIVDIVFTAIKATLDNQIANYENGKKGGRPKKENTMEKNQKGGFLQENNPPYENEKTYKEKEKEKEKEEEKGKEKEKEFSFTLSRETQFENLSNEYKSKLKDEIDKLNLNLSYDDFVEGLMIKSYKYKNFLLAYKKWAKNSFKKTTSKDDDYTLDDLKRFGYKG